MYDRILVPTDGSEPATTAVEAALAVADRFDATVHAIHVSELPDLPTDVQAEADSHLEEFADSILTSVADRADDVGVTVTTDVLEYDDAVHQIIVDYVRDHDVDLVVMGTHGRTGLDRIALGSVTERTLRVSPVPVLTVSDDVDFDPMFREILVPTDGSHGATAAVEHGIGLAGLSDSKLHVVHVVDVTGIWSAASSGAILKALEESGRQAVDDALARAEAAGLESTQASVLDGTPARAIVDYADDRDVDLVVMGTHGRTGLDRYLLGSVTEHVVRLADRPVMSVSSMPDERRDS